MGAAHSLYALGFFQMARACWIGKTDPARPASRTIARMIVAAVVLVLGVMRLIAPCSTPEFDGRFGVSQAPSLCVPPGMQGFFFSCSQRFSCSHRLRSLVLRRSRRKTHGLKRHRKGDVL
jgi:hypothetical protein